MIYLASPYHHPDPQVRAQRLAQAEDAMHQLFPHRVFSPIAHNGHSSERFGAQTPSNYLLFDFEILSKCTALCVLEIPGWNTSRGVLMEVGYAIANNIELRIARKLKSTWVWRTVKAPELLDLIYKE